jgi:hypothetical protein
MFYNYFTTFCGSPQYGPAVYSTIFQIIDTGSSKVIISQNGTHCLPLGAYTGENFAAVWLIRTKVLPLGVKLCRQDIFRH